MDELDILKKDWKKKDHSFNQITEKEIYGMLHKRSSSIVKWILIISICEFLILRILDISSFFDKSSVKMMEKNHLYNFSLVLTIFNLIVFSGFIIYFYKNFKKISAASSIKKLMSDILKTRKIVKYYIWYNLILISITTFFVLNSFFKYNKEINELYEKFPSIFILGSIATVLFIVLFFWGLYKLLYGILLKRLHNNYQELKKLEL
ncbi:hypothetical protein [uncultured Flavobacterium sp.]|uniref:hypothetical protein n=1 Tax=uncultured Flavobacterium sp. TaxID=165435 RepID=UPI0030EEBD07|tara:strand:+ start:63203 stop:63820 length:618 start_codon:yes stop_codon:yes gene_type:complete